MATTPDFLKPLNSFKTEEDQTTPPTQAVPDFLQPLRREPVAAPSSLEESVTPDQAPQAAGDRFPDSPSMTAPTGRLLPMEGGQGRPPALGPDPNFPDSPNMTAPSLPKPSMSMYSGMSYDDATALYNRFREDPKTTSNPIGALSYDGVNVPFPKRGLFGSGPGIPQYTAGIVRNTGRNLIGTAGAVADFAQSKFQLFDKDGNWSPKLGRDEDNPVEPGLLSRAASGISKVESGDSLGSELALEGGQLILGGIFGLKGADKLLSGIKPLSDIKTLRTFSKFLGFEVGASSSIDQDVSLIALGPNALFKNEIPILRGARPDADDAEYEKILKNRMNILAEGMMLAKPAEVGLKTAAWLATGTWSLTVAPLINAFKRGSKEEAVVNEVLNQLAIVGSRDDTAALEAKKAVADIIRENGDVIVKIGEDFGPDITMSLDTASALERGLKASGDGVVSDQLTARVRGLRSGAMNQGGGAPELTTKLGEPVRQFENLTSRAEDFLGGEQGIESARRGLVESGQADVAAVRGVGDDIDLRLAEAETNLETLIRDDPTFGAQLDSLNQKSGVMVYSGPSQTMDEIVGNVRQAYESMTATKNNLYSQIQGGKVKPEGLLQVLNNMRPGQLDAAAGAMPANSQFGDLLNVARRQTVQEADAAGTMVARPETDEELLQRFSNWMDQNELDFGKLYTNIRPSVSQTAENLFSSSSPEGQAAARVLRDFTNYIDSRALDDVIASGDGAVAEAALAAKEFYMRDYVRFWRDGALKDVSDLYGQTVGRTSADMAEQGLQVRPLDFQAGTRQTIESSLTDANREYAGQIVRLLDRPEAGQNAPLVTDFVIGRAVDSLDEAISVGGRLSDIDISRMVGELRSYRDLVAENFPEQAQRINQFVNNIGQSRNNIEVLRTQLDEARVIAKQAEDALYSGELSKFFKGVGIENPDGYNVFASILSNNQSADTISQLVARAEATGDPLVLRGMQAAYARFVRDRFLGSTQEIGGNRAMKMGNLSQEDEGIRNVLEYGDQLFPDRPDFMESVRELLDVSGLVTRSKGAKAVATDSATASRMEALKSSNQMITMVFGVLNRVGARLRSASTTIINKVSPDEAGMRLLDAVMADKDYFLQIADRVIAKQTPMDPEIRDMLFSLLVRTGVYTAGDEEDFITAMAQQELELRDKMNDLGTQMDEAFAPRN